MEKKKKQYFFFLDKLIFEDKKKERSKERKGEKKNNGCPRKKVKLCYGLYLLSSFVRGWGCPMTETFLGSVWLVSVRIY